MIYIMPLYEGVIPSSKKPWHLRGKTVDIFALQGPANSGKTDTLIRVRDLLQAKYPSASLTSLHNGSGDIKVIFRGINGKTVGIESQGDPNSRLKESLLDFQRAGCDIIFCACRTSGMTVAWIKALSPPYQTQFVQKVRTTHNHGSTNAAVAASLVQMSGL